MTGSAFGSFIRHIFNQKDTGFMTSWETRMVFSVHNHGLVINSDTLRLSEKYSMNHLLMVAPSGMGKTTSFVHPNIAALDDCSIIITDPKGSTLEQYASTLLAKDYEIIMLDFINPQRSHHFNPLSACQDLEDIDSMVQQSLLMVTAKISLAKTPHLS